MNQRYYNNTADKARQDNLRREIERQVDDYLNRGGKIQQLQGPSLQPHKAVAIRGAALIETF